MSADDDAPTPEELREADALARSLDGDASAPVPADVMSVVHLLRHAQASPTLAPDRSQVVEARLRADLSPRWRRWRWWWMLPPLAAAATAAVVLTPLRRPSDSAAQVRPSGALLAAQAAAARGDRAALDRLDREMRSHRRALFRRLAEGGQ